MYFCPRLKSLFIHVHRTGGSSVSNLLVACSGYIWTQQDCQHASYRTVSDRTLFEEPDMYIFGFVRNPWERIFSWYLFLKQRTVADPVLSRQDFADFVIDWFDLIQKDTSQNRFFFNQLDYFPIDEHGVHGMSRIGRFETLNQDIKLVFADLGLKMKEVPHTNQSQSLDFRRFYDKKTRHFVADKTAKDLEFFGYTFD